MRSLQQDNFEVDAALFIGSSGRTTVRLDAEYSFLSTEKLILASEIEINAYGPDTLVAREAMELNYEDKNG